MKSKSKDDWTTDLKLFDVYAQCSLNGEVKITTVTALTPGHAEEIVAGKLGNEVIQLRAQEVEKC